MPTRRGETVRMESWYDLIASLVDSLIWPGVVVWLAIVFRDRLGKLIDKVVSVRVGDNRVDFAGGLADAQQRAEGIGDEPEADQLAKGQAPEDGSTTLRKALGLAERQPRIAITDASLVVDDELNAAAERLEIPIPRGARPTPEGAWRRLRYWGHLNEDWVALLRRVYDLQRKAELSLPHDISREQARDYVDLCSRVVDQLQRLGPRETRGS